MDKRLVRFGLLSLLLVGAAIFWVVQKQKPAVQVQKVGMLLPLEHEAMTQEVAGFREELQAVFGENVQIDVKNAQGDVGIQRALLLQFAQGDYQAVAVVGTTASLMALQIFASSSSNRSAPTPLIALDVDPGFTQHAGEFTGTLETDVDVAFHYFRRAFTQVRRVSLVYAAEDKTYNQAKQFVRQAKQFGLIVQELMVQQPADLYTVSGLVDSRSQMIVVLKDHMVASGIAPLVQRAIKQGIALFTSDDGTVRAGSALALGVAEADIGRQGARLAAQILQGRKASSLPMQRLQQQTLFVNLAAAKQQAIDVTQAVQTAQEMGYRVQYLSREGKAEKPAEKP